MFGEETRNLFGCVSLLRHSFYSSKNLTFTFLCHLFRHAIPSSAAGKFEILNNRLRVQQQLENWRRQGHRSSAVRWLLWILWRHSVGIFGSLQQECGAMAMPEDEGKTALIGRLENSCVCCEGISEYLNSIPTPCYEHFKLNPRM